MKTVARFEPTPSRTAEECERHYVRVHVPMAQDLLRPMDGMLSYHVGRAIAQADAAGGFEQRPHAWRFVTLRFAEDRTLAFTPEQLEMVSRDHVNCLYRLRSHVVAEEVLLDRLRGQTATAKFVFDVQRPEHVDPDAARRAFAELAGRVRHAMTGAFGARRLVADHVLDEAVTEPVDVEGQRVVGTTTDTTRVGFLACHFDHSRWGRDALGALTADPALRGAGPVRAELFELDEHCALDLAG